MNFLKWLILTLFYGLTLGVLEKDYQVLTKVYEFDISFICCGIAGAFVAGVWFSFLRCFRKDNNFARVEYMEKLAPQLGLLGTVVGIMYTMYSVFLAGLVVGDQDSLDNVWRILSEGMAVSLLTTLIGLVTAIALSSYVFVLKDYRNENTN